MLRIEEGEPWVMWPDNLVANFIDYPANKIFDYNGEFEFKLVFELVAPVKRKSTLFSKLPSYFGIDIEEYGLLLIVTEDTKNTEPQTGNSGGPNRYLRPQVESASDKGTTGMESPNPFQAKLRVWSCMLCLSPSATAPAPSMRSLECAGISSNCCDVISLLHKYF